ncbi:DUF6134 family protein [Zunongwangia sp.]|uniref:DUF6134 family protein n=1 Tax=Zunongwangia sp. TaxID=1965325 RepID=UPI003AA9D964
MIKTVLTLFIFCYTLTVFSQQKQLVFDVIHRDKKIGEFVASRVKNNKIITYTSKTAIEARLLAKINVNYNFEVLYEDDLMQKAYTEVIVNGKRRTDSKTIKRKNSYLFFDCGDHESTINYPISFSSILLIFEEPISVSKIYSEENGNFQKITRVKSHCYTKENKKGRVNTYFYRNGLLQKAFIDSGLIDFELQIQEK